VGWLLFPFVVKSEDEEKYGLPICCRRGMYVKIIEPNYVFAGLNASYYYCFREGLIDCD
jgi:hypothetical protein